MYWSLELNPKVKKTNKQQQKTKQLYLFTVLFFAGLYLPGNEAP